MFEHFFLSLTHSAVCRNEDECARVDISIRFVFSSKSACRTSTRRRSTASKCRKQTQHNDDVWCVYVKSVLSPIKFYSCQLTLSLSGLFTLQNTSLFFYARALFRRKNSGPTGHGYTVIDIIVILLLLFLLLLLLLFADTPFVIRPRC